MDYLYKEKYRDLKFKLDHLKYRINEILQLEDDKKVKDYLLFLLEVIDDYEYVDKDSL